MARVQKALTDREVRELAKTSGVNAVGGVAGLVLRRRENAQGVVTSTRWYPASRQKITQSPETK